MVDKNHDAALYEQQEEDLKGRTKLDPQYSIREKMLDAMPAYATMLESVQSVVEENNKRVAEAIIHSFKRFHTMPPVFLGAAVGTQDLMIKAPFPIRHVLIRNKSGQTCYFNQKSLGPASGANDIDFISQAYSWVATGKYLSLPVTFGDEIYFRLKTTYTPTTDTYAFAYLFSEPQAPALGSE